MHYSYRANFNRTGNVTQLIGNVCTMADCTKAQSTTEILLCKGTIQLSHTPDLELHIATIAEDIPDQH